MLVFECVVYIDVSVNVEVCVDLVLSLVWVVGV